MSDSFEHFIAGQDKLSTLLRQLPPYEPSSTLDTRFAEAARNARQQPVAHVTFEAPPGMESDFLRMAAKIDTAQQARRQATLHSIATGTPVDIAMGGSLKEPGKAWLKQQIPVTRTPPARPLRWWQVSWRDIQVIGLAAILAAWCTHFYLQRRPTSTETVMLEAFRQASTADKDDSQDESSSLAAKLEEAIQANLRQHATSLTAGSPAKRSVHEAHAASTASPTDKPQHNSTPKENQLAAQTAPQEQGEPSVAVLATAPAADTLESVPETRGQLQHREAAEIKLLKALPAPRSPAVSTGAPGSDERSSQSEHPDMAAPAPAPVAAPAQRSGDAHIPLHASLRDDPSIIAARLTGSGTVTYTIICFNPEDPALLAWMEKLRRALQENGKKNLIKVQKDTNLGESHLLIQSAPD